jgi:hypothetical protein
MPGADEDVTDTLRAVVIQHRQIFDDLSLARLNGGTNQNATADGGPEMGFDISIAETDEMGSVPLEKSNTPVLRGDR